MDADTAARVSGAGGVAMELTEESSTRSLSRPSRPSSRLSTASLHHESSSGRLSPGGASGSSPVDSKGRWSPTPTGRDSPGGGSSRRSQGMFNTPSSPSSARRRCVKALTLNAGVWAPVAAQPPVWGCAAARRGFPVRQNVPIRVTKHGAASQRFRMVVWERRGELLSAREFNSKYNPRASGSPRSSAVVSPVPSARSLRSPSPGSTARDGGDDNDVRSVSEELQQRYVVSWTHRQQLEDRIHDLEDLVRCAAPPPPPLLLRRMIPGRRVCPSPRLRLAQPSSPELRDVCVCVCVDSHHDADACVPQHAQP